MIAAFGLCAALLITGITNATLSSLYAQESADFRMQAESRYRRLFPDERNLVNLESQLRTHIRKLRGADIEQGSAPPFLPLLARLTVVLNNEVVSAHITVERVYYSGHRGELLLEITANSLAKLNSINEQLNSGDMVSRLESARAEDSSYHGRLRVGVANG